MKLDTEKKVLLCQKALYSKQLEHYRELCGIYRELANIVVRRYQMKDTPEASVASQVQNYYTSYLSKAAKGDLSFLKHNGIIDNGYLTSKFTPTQVSLFEKYSYESERIHRYQAASEKLQDATFYEGKFDVDQRLIDNYHDFMESDSETKSFDKFIAENSKRWIGRISYLKSIKELNKIKSIDADHVAVLSGRSITPKSFGATITGARGRLSQVKSHLQQEVSNSFSPEEQYDFKKPASKMEKFANNTYKLGYNTKKAITDNVKEFYTAHKGTLEKAIKRGTIIALSLGAVAFGTLGIDAMQNRFEFNNEVYLGNPSYVQTVSVDTESTLEQTGDYLESLENSSTTPTADQLHTARTMVDDEINEIFTDIVTIGFQEAYPNLIVDEGGVTILYNDTHIDPTSGKGGNYIYINCHDINGKPYQFKVESFGSQGENRAAEAFENERALDDLTDDINVAHSGNFEANTKSVSEILDELQEFHQDNIELAGSKGFVDIPAAEYANKKATDKENVFDYIKTKFGKPIFKTVIPEKHHFNINEGDER